MERLAIIFVVVVVTIRADYPAGTRNHAQAPYQQHGQHDPHAEYYDQYASQDALYAVADSKQGFAGVMEGVLGPDAGLILVAAVATVAALASVAALVGVALNNNNVDSLSKDQDSICTATRGLGDTTFATVASDVSLVNLAAAYNIIIGQLNTVATPDCLD